jgi:hypothetical protein
MKMSINDVSEIIQKANDAIEQYKAENPGVNVEDILAEQNKLLIVM